MHFFIYAGVFVDDKRGFRKKKCSKVQREYTTIRL